MAIVWALNFSVIKSSLQEIDPFSFNAIRFILAASVVWLVVLKRGQTFRVPRRDWLPLLMMGLMGSFIYQGLFIIGIDYTFSANAAVMLGTIPIWVALFAHFFFDEKLTPLKTLGILSAFAGITLIIAGGEHELSFSSTTLVGDLLIVGAAVVFGLYTLLSKSMLSRYTPLQYSAMMATIGSAALLTAGFPGIIRLDWSAVSLQAYGGILYSGLFAIGAAYIIWNYGIQTVGAVRTSTYQNLVPVLGLIFGVTLLHEQLVLLQYIGSALVIAGIVLARR